MPLLRAEPGELRAVAHEAGHRLRLLTRADHAGKLLALADGALELKEEIVVGGDRCSVLTGRASPAAGASGN